ncbi:hypothetical protein D9613_005655 [Agrocybe pediades]|uniref:Uncharacterized protein n=1 Tax=Agrocybe pediades TaxID=84607 RepID=A0A8H4QUW7_9AGAR|nr:hypothetical protein D9613_005655 [Agrocybe pediades]
MALTTKECPACELCAPGPDISHGRRLSHPPRCSSSPVYLPSVYHSPALMELSTFLSTLTAHPEVAKHLDFNACLAFIELIQLLKPALQLYLNPDFEEPMPLSELPVDILKFFELSLDLDHESAKMIWEILCPIAWALGSPSDIQAFDYGLSRGVAFFTFIPPTHTCLDPGCNSKTRTGKKAGVPYSRELYQEKTVAVTVFTQDFGPVPGLSVSFSCKAVT